MEKLQRRITGYIKKWLRVPWCLTTIGLYGEGVLKLPLTSLTEEFKCAKATLQMTLNEPRDLIVSNNVLSLASGCKWRPAKAVEEATAALRHADIVGHVQQGSLQLPAQLGIKTQYQNGGKWWWRKSAVRRRL